MKLAWPMKYEEKWHFNTYNCKRLRACYLSFHLAEEFMMILMLEPLVMRTCGAEPPLTWDELAKLMGNTPLLF